MSGTRINGGSSGTIRPTTSARQYLRIASAAASALLFIACHPACADGRSQTWLLGAAQALDEQPRAAVTNQGIVATFSTSAGVLRHTKTLGLGIDNPSGGDPRGIDRAEAIAITFDRDLFFTAFFVGSWSRKYGDRGLLKLNDTVMASIEKTGYHQLTPFFVPKGWTLRFEGINGSTHGQPNGWTLTSFSTALP